MRLGIALPTAGTTASAAGIVEVAETAERVGLHSLWTFERLLAPIGGAEVNGQKFALPEAYDTVFSPLEVLAFAAARTSRITLGTSIVIALLHNPVALGRSFATLDQLSGGRIVVGIGQGWMPQEFEAAGVPLSRRGARFSEFVDALRAVWGPDPVSFDGQFYRIAESHIGPKPLQDGGPLTIVGAASPAGIRRAAQLGLGLNPIWFGWEALQGQLQAFHAAATEAGHDPTTLPIVLRVNEGIATTASGDEATPAGSPQQIVEALPRLAELGVTEVLWSIPGEIDEQLTLAAEVVELAGTAA